MVIIKHETNSDLLKLSWAVPLILEIVPLGLLPYTPARSLLMELGFASQFRVRNLSAGILEVHPSPIKAVLAAKASGVYRK